MWGKKNSQKNKIKKKANCRPWYDYVRQPKEQQNFSDQLFFTIATE